MTSAPLHFRSLEADVGRLPPSSTTALAFRWIDRTVRELLPQVLREQRASEAQELSSLSPVVDPTSWAFALTVVDRISSELAGAEGDAAAAVYTVLSTDSATPREASIAAVIVARCGPGDAGRRSLLEEETQRRDVESAVREQQGR